MQKTNSFLISILFLSVISIGVFSSCANMMPPSGGPKDSLPPVLITAVPKDSATNVSSNRISLVFDEYITLDNAQQNVIVSPNPQNSPVIDAKLRGVNIRLRDSLLPNTTYSINFGNSIRDVNENNILKNFTYVFSTGSKIDMNTIVGKVTLAQNGKVDSTLIVVLHRNLNDSAIQKLRPVYYARLDGQGNFRFNNLPAGKFAVYVTEDDYAKRYDDSTELFAFADTAVATSSAFNSINLYAFRAAEKAVKGPAAPSSNRNVDRKLRYTTNITDKRKDLLTPIELTFNKRLKSFDSNAIVLTDTNFANRVKPRFLLDSSGTKLSVINNWKENQHWVLIIPSTAVTDTSGTQLSKTDTIKFTTDPESQYGSLRLRFANVDTSKHQVLLIMQNDKLIESIPITSGQWYKPLYQPGEYQLYLLNDKNRNGKWDTGSFKPVKNQPEIVTDLKRKINIRANWDNEEVINL